MEWLVKLLKEIEKYLKTQGLYLHLCSVAFVFACQTAVSINCH